jgi:two-component system response regulator NreC
MSESDIRVLIVDDHAILRDGIRSLLERQEGIIVVGEAGNGRQALEGVEQCQPDVILMDVAMPEMDGIEATRRIKASHPHVDILILTQHDDREYVKPLLQAGASGYVLKRAGGREVITAIREVVNEGAYLESSVARRVLDEYSRPDEAGQEQIPHLTDREREVLNLVLAGKSNKEIGHMLTISPKTVSVHRSNIMSKLNVHNSFELMRYVKRHRLLGVNLGDSDL